MPFEQTPRQAGPATVQTMIQISQETLIPLSEGPYYLPPRRGGKRVHISAFYRWVSTGSRGVRLDSLKLGGTTYTSLEALQRFAEALTKRERPAADAGLEVHASKGRAARAASQQLERELNLAPGRLSQVQGTNEGTGKG